MAETSRLESSLPGPGDKGKFNICMGPNSNIAIVKVTLRQTGNTPALVNKTFWVQRSQTVRWVVEFIKQQLKCQPHESLVSYISMVLVSRGQTLAQALID